MAGEKCIIILSEKSSGSSACQNLLARYAHLQHVRETRHGRHETLYWTKAASVLGMDQLKMVDSEVPIEAGKAKAEIIALLEANLGNYTPPADELTLVRQGWRLLCIEYSPIYLEKSPHHLCQWSALELIIDAMEHLKDIDFLLIGLVRNPMDTIYSQYTRWKSPPEEIERQWCVAYNNLLRLQERLGEQLLIVRYEDMVSSLDSLEPVFRFCGVQPDTGAQTYMHRDALKKWRTDRFFGFTPAESTVALAQRYNYSADELANESFVFWPVVYTLSRAFHRSMEFLRRSARKRFKR